MNFKKGREEERKNERRKEKKRSVQNATFNKISYINNLF